MLNYQRVVHRAHKVHRCITCSCPLSWEKHGKTVLLRKPCLENFDGHPPCVNWLGKFFDGSSWIVASSWWICTVIVIVVYSYLCYIYNIYIYNIYIYNTYIYIHIEYDIKLLVPKWWPPDSRKNHLPRNIRNGALRRMLFLTEATEARGCSYHLGMDDPFMVILGMVYDWVYHMIWWKKMFKTLRIFLSFPRMFSILRTPGTQSWCRYPIIIPDTLRNDVTWQLWNEYWISLDLQAMRRFMAFPPSAALGATVTRPPFGPVATAGEGPGAPQQPQVLLGQKPTPPEQPQFRCSWGLCCGCSVSLVFSNVFHGSLAYAKWKMPTPVQTGKGQIFEMLRRCQIHPMVAWLQTKRAGTVQCKTVERVPQNSMAMV